MISTSSVASLRSTDSSLSSYSDTSADGNLYDREYGEDRIGREDSSSSSNGHMDSSNQPVKQNGFHESGNSTNRDVSNVDRFIKTSETAGGHQEAENDVERVCSYVHEDPETSSLSSDDVDAEFWLPPESEDQVDDVIGSVANCDDDDEDDGNWATSSSLSGFGEESKFKEDKIKAMNEVRNGKFMALVSQLIKSVGVECSENQGENWVDIVTNLSWEAASFVKPDAQEGKAMDPDGYVKVKCIATGSRTQSQIIKGLVFKKHAAHKHMQTKYKNPRLLLIQGALDLSSGGLSSFQSMHQEKDNLKYIVEMIDTYHPNVILVEKSVSRDIQESILKKGITLVFDMKLHRLERVARCIGTPISSSELPTGQKLRQCDSFHIEKFVEELAPQEGGKKQCKTLMFLEGAPARRGCTILLMGADSVELKRIKCVVRCAVVMAHHLMLETSFLLDQSAMFSSISPGEVVDLVLTNHQLTPVTVDEVPVHKESDTETNSSSTSDIPISNGLHETGLQHNDNSALPFEPYSAATFPGLSLSTSIQKVMNESFPLLPDLRSVSGADEMPENVIQISSDDHLKVKSEDENPLNDQAENLEFSDTRDNSDSADEEIQSKDESEKLEFSDTRDNSDGAEEEIKSKDKISSVLESESILVLMSSRNATRGTICEQRHFSHIKFYRSFDVPLGKFLRDDILNQRLQCKNCAEPPEAHIYYYAHHNKQLTVRVRRIPAVKSLPGDSDGKLWMWSRCGQCKLHNGTPKTTKRVLISSAAGGLSFGKFLELSFSNNSSFKGSSSCGHSFHKDFLYFFGLGPMVAMFKYATVSTYSVALPPQMMEFKSTVKCDFLKKDCENVHAKGMSMFLDIEKSLKDIGTRYVGVTLSIHGSNKEFSDILEILEKEKLQFEVDIQEAIKNRSEGYAVCNLLRLNRVRLELLLESCLWDRRLHALLSSDVKVVETDPVDVQAEEQHSKEDDDTAREESSTVDVTVENCECDKEDTCGDETMLEDASVRKNELSIEEIPIVGQVEEFEEHNTMSLVSDDVSNLNMSELNENGSNQHSGNVEEMVQHDNSDSSAELQTEIVVPIATDTESTESTSNHFLTNKRQLSVSPDRENDKGWIWAPVAEIQREYMEDLQRGYLPKLGSFSSYPVESVAKKLISEEGSRLHIPLGMNDYIVSDYEDELSSIIACALTLLMEESNALEYLAEDGRRERLLDPKLSGSSNNLTQAFSLNAPRWASFGSFDADSIHSPSSLEDSHSSSFDGLDLLDSLVSYGANHPEVSMGLSKHSGKRKYSVICLYASEFRELRERCCPSELDYIASLSRCKNWDAKGGKSKSFFAKTLDDRFIIKEIKRTEFDSFMKFAPNFFDYMNECYELGNQTCLAKILGVYQVALRGKNGKESRHDLLVMENLSFGRNIARQYDLKGALHARFSSSGNGSGEVLLDQNFVNDMNVSPLYVSRKSKRHLQRAVYNDTNFLNSINVMDYSLLVGVDTQRQELVGGIIDYLRQYTWDKQLENWVKSSLVVPKNQLPTIVSPREYKKRFRKFIDTHFLSVPDHWCSQRSSNPCKLCGPADETVPSQTKAHSNGKHDAVSSKSSHNGKQNGTLA